MATPLESVSQPDEGTDNPTAGRKRRSVISFLKKRTKKLFSGHHSPRGASANDEGDSLGVNERSEQCDDQGSILYAENSTDSESGNVENTKLKIIASPLEKGQVLNSARDVSQSNSANQVELETGGQSSGLAEGDSMSADVFKMAPLTVAMVKEDEVVSESKSAASATDSSLDSTKSEHGQNVENDLRERALLDTALSALRDSSDNSQEATVRVESVGLSQAVGDALSSPVDVTENNMELDGDEAPLSEDGTSTSDFGCTHIDSTESLSVAATSTPVETQPSDPQQRQENARGKDRCTIPKNVKQLAMYCRISCVSFTVDWLNSIQPPTTKSIRAGSSISYTVKTCKLSM